MLEKKNIVIVATGGTIAGEAISHDSKQYVSGKIGADELISVVPDLDKIAKIETYQFSQVGSQDFDNELLLKLARKIAEIVQRKDVDGVVITHGTDTMEESAFFCDLTISTTKPIIFTGAMRPANAVDADGPKNILHAVKIAVDEQSQGRGVLVAMNGKTFTAREVTKSHTTDLDAFRSEGKSKTSAKFDLSTIEKLAKVEMLYGYSSDQSNVIEQMIKDGTKGIIYAGVGNGNIYHTTLKKLQEMAKKGIVVVRSSRVGSGSVTRNAEINDDESGFVTADNLNPQKARILLSLVLSQSNDPQEIQKFF